MKKKRKPLVGTWYAVHDHGDDLFWNDVAGTWGSFARCTLYPSRCSARGKEMYWGWDANFMEIVSVRCRALSTRTKASRKRTR